MTAHTISEDDFFDVYVPVPSTKAGGELLRDFDNVRDLPACHVWTVVDGDDGGMYALAGFHVVNRVGYLLTERPWQDEQAEAVYWAAEDEEDDDE